jgi:radical SAM protein with 4Fe4S-binding SPASM domain
MPIENLKRQLLQQFNVICFEDLAGLRQKHRTIFDLFKLHRKDRFEDNDRLVLYSAYEPEQDFLDHIQRAAARIDISNFFILIVCPFDVTEKLYNSNQKFGYDSNVIQSMIYKLEDTEILNKTNFYQIDSICPFPFGHAHIDYNGDVAPCCKFQGRLGTSQDSSLGDIFDGDFAKSIRNQMLSGQKPKECSTCWHNETAGTTSFRQLALHKFGDILDQEWLDDPKIRDINWCPTSICNFTCRICNFRSSTSIATEEIKFSKDPDFKQLVKGTTKETNDTVRIKNTIQNIAQLDDLEYLHILGGEPLLWPQLQELIDRLTQNELAQNIIFEINTNCSVYPDQQIAFIIQQFKQVEILLSVDNVGTRFEIERGGKWEDILENIKKFVSLKSPTVTVKLATTINLQNILDLDDIIDFADTLGIEILWWYLERPTFLCIDNATEHTKHLVFSKYSTHPEPELRKIAHRVLTSVGSDGSEFLEYCHKIDQRRGQSFCSSHQEIYESMGGRI